MAERMSKTRRKFTVILILALLGAVVGGVVWLRRPMTWERVARITKVLVPAGAVMSAVAHPIRMKYSGTIDLPSDADVQAFIHLNKLRPMSDFVQRDGRVHQGFLADEVPKERYADTYMRLTFSYPNAWEFIVDPATRRVRYEFLVPGSMFDFLWDAPDDESPP